MANRTLINNLKYITDKALADIASGYNDPNLEQTIGGLIQSGAISSEGQSYDKTLQEAVSYYKYIKGETSLGDLSTTDPLLSNMKIISDKAIADRVNGYNDPNIEETMRSLVRSGAIKLDNGDENLTVEEAVWYYNYIKGPNVQSQTSTQGSDSSSTDESYSSTSGTTTSTDTVVLKDPSISGIIAAINECTNDIDTLLAKISNDEINTINNSWVAQETSSYVAKVNEATDKMKKINEALRLLASTFNEVLKMNEETSSQVKSYVDNITE